VRPCFPGRYAPRFDRCGTPVAQCGHPPGAAHRTSIERLFAEELHPNCRVSPEQDAERSFNISLGLSLSGYPLVQAALLILRINPGSTITFDDVTRILRCPFIDGASEEAHVAYKPLAFSL